MRSTNQANEGVDDRKSVKGKVVFEREFAGILPSICRGTIIRRSRR
jgi:hypothetical protein